MAKYNPQNLNKLIQSAMANGYPQALQIQVTVNNRAIYKKKFGPKYTYFDLASLTKILVTTPLIMKLVEYRLIKLEDKLENHLPIFKKTRVGSVNVKSLLNHSSGLHWWRPFYQKLQSVPKNLRKATVQKLMKLEPLDRPGHCVYADLDMMILGWLIEEKFQMGLEEIQALYLAKPLGLKNTFYIPDLKIRKLSAFAPTDRKGRDAIRGVVHDQNSRALGGVSGHSGLFSTLDETAKIAQVYYEVLRGSKSPFMSKKILKEFTTRSVPKRAGDWALGFTIPSRPISSAGRNVSARAFGHTGFTGTSIWIDPARNAVVTILSNRTYPTSKDERFLQLRRDLHDAIWEMIDG